MCLCLCVLLFAAALSPAAAQVHAAQYSFEFTEGYGESQGNGICRLTDISLTDGPVIGPAGYHSAVTSNGPCLRGAVCGRTHVCVHIYDEKTCHYGIVHDRCSNIITLNYGKLGNGICRVYGSWATKPLIGPPGYHLATNVSTLESKCPPFSPCDDRVCIHIADTECNFEIMAECPASTVQFGPQGNGICRVYNTKLQKPILARPGYHEAEYSSALTLDGIPVRVCVHIKDEECNFDILDKCPRNDTSLFVQYQKHEISDATKLCINY